MGYNSAIKNMADRRSTYVFDREEDYNDCRDHLWREMYSDYNDSDCIYFYGWWGGEYRIDIMSECSDAPRVADIIREHRGKYREI